METAAPTIKSGRALRNFDAPGLYVKEGEKILGLRRHQENLPAIRATGLGAGRKAANVDDSTSKGA